MGPVAIHLGDHGTYEPAGTTIIEQHSRQQTTKQVVVRKFQIRKTETTEAMTRMKRIQRSKPTVISHCRPIQWNGVIKTAIFEGHGRKSNLQHGDLMLQQELRHDGMIWSESIILIHIHSNLSPGFIPTTQRWVDIEQIVMPAHELQLTYGRRVNPIQHYQIPRPHGNQPEVKQKEGTEMNDFAFNAINSNSEERTSSMSDYSTSTTPNETRYQENTPTVTPEIVNDEVVDAEVLDDNDADLVETNPVAALAGNFEAKPVMHHLASGETNYTEQEACRVTEDLKVKLLHALEAQYDLVQAAQKAFAGHIWIALGYPEGTKGWVAYCKDNFTSEKIRVTGQQRTDLIMGFDPSKISNRGIAALLGVDHRTVDRVKAKAGIAPAEGRIRDAAGKRRHVDTGSMSSEERRKKIVELSEEGAKQTDIADMLDVSQSTVSDTLRKDRMRRMSEGLEPAKIDNTDFDNADDDQPLDLDMGNRETDIRSYIDSFVSQSSDARGAINEMVHLLESDKWQPGGSTVSEIVSRSGANIFGIISDMCKMLRLLNIDVDNVFDGADAELDDTDNDWSRFIDGCTELAIVCQEITA